MGAPFLGAKLKMSSSLLSNKEVLFFAEEDGVVFGASSPPNKEMLRDGVVVEGVLGCGKSVKISLSFSKSAHTHRLNYSLAHTHTHTHSLLSGGGAMDDDDDVFMSTPKLMETPKKASEAFCHSRANSHALSHTHTHTHSHTCTRISHTHSLSGSVSLLGDDDDDDYFGTKSSATPKKTPQIRSSLFGDDDDLFSNPLKVDDVCVCVCVCVQVCNSVCEYARFLRKRERF